MPIWCVSVFFVCVPLQLDLSLLGMPRLRRANIATALGVFAALQAFHAFASGSDHGGIPCARDEDCSLNGVCEDGACKCDKGWTTLPFGPGGSMSPGCG